MGGRKKGGDTVVLRILNATRESEQMTLDVDANVDK